MIDLASDSEDEKKIGKAKAAAEKKGKEAKTNSGNTSKNLSLLVIFNFFAVRPLLIFTLWSSRTFWLDCLSIQPSICCIYLSMILRGK